MKRKLSDLEISGFCREMALLFHAGVQAGDGLTLLAGEQPDAGLAALFEEMAKAADGGAAFSAVLRGTGRFPTYLTGLAEVGERTGRLEETLNSLAAYYQQREKMNRQLQGALTYPAILLLMMLVVIVVLLSQVLPVFDEVYASLGGRLTGVGGGLLVLGGWLDSAMPLLCAALAAAALAMAAFSLSEGFRERALKRWHGINGDKGVSRRMNDARFAQAMSMGLKSGLPLEEALELSAALLKDTPPAVERCRRCRAMLGEGAELSEAMRASGVLPAAECRLLALGLRGGSGDAVMEEIAARLSDEAELALERRVSQIEPSLVLVTSLLVGAILLTVMLPLMNIMAAIG